MTVASLEPLAKRLQGSCLWAGSQAMLVIHLLWPAPASDRQICMILKGLCQLALESHLVPQAWIQWVKGQPHMLELGCVV